MTLALPEVLALWPIKPYPTNKPPKWPVAASLARLNAADLPECNVVHDGDCFIKAVKINGCWHDPIEWGMLASVIRCMENECAEIEREVRAEGVE